MANASARFQMRGMSLEAGILSLGFLVMGLMRGQLNKSFHLHYYERLSRNPTNPCTIRNTTPVQKAVTGPNVAFDDVPTDRLFGYGSGIHYTPHW